MNPETLKQMRDAAEWLKNTDWPERDAVELCLYRDALHRKEESPWTGFTKPAGAFIALLSPANVSTLIADYERVVEEVDRLRRLVYLPGTRFDDEMQRDHETEATEKAVNEVLERAAKIVNDARFEGEYDLRSIANRIRTEIRSGKPQPDTSKCCVECCDHDPRFRDNRGECQYSANPDKLPCGHRCVTARPVRAPELVTPSSQSAVTRNSKREAFPPRSDRPGDTECNTTDTGDDEI